MCGCGQNQPMAEFGSPNMFEPHINPRTGQPCAGLPNPLSHPGGEDRQDPAQQAGRNQVEPGSGTERGGAEAHDGQDQQQQHDDVHTATVSLSGAAANVHIRARYGTAGGHVHCSVWSSESGPDTTHGRNGTLVFRPAEFEAFRHIMTAGGAEFIEYADESDPPVPSSIAPG